MINRRLRIVLSLICLVALGGALTLLLPEWMIALAPASIVIIVLMNLNPLFEMVLALAPNHRDDAVN